MPRIKEKANTDWYRPELLACPKASVVYRRGSYSIEQETVRSCRKVHAPEWFTIQPAFESTDNHMDKHKTKLQPVFASQMGQQASSMCDRENASNSTPELSRVEDASTV